MSDIHSCSYYCTRPACVLAQRDEMRDTLMKQAEPVAEPVAIPGAIPIAEVAAKSRAMPERAEALERARERLVQAEPVVERINAGPVGYRYKYPDGDWRFSGGIKINGCDPIDYEPVYTHPAVKQQQAEPVWSSVRGECRLWDSQWTNVVNHANCYAGWSKEDAINHAVRMTETYMARNVKINYFPPAQQAEPVAEPVDKLLTKDEPPVDKEQAEPLQGGLTEREICAWKMGYDAAKAEQAEPVVDERNIN